MDLGYGQLVVRIVTQCSLLAFLLSCFYSAASLTRVRDVIFICLFVVVVVVLERERERDCLSVIINIHKSL